MSHPNDNPWQDEASQTNRNNQGYANPNPYSTYQDQTQPGGPPNPYSQQPPSQQYASPDYNNSYAPPDHPPPQQQQRYYQGTNVSPPHVNEALHSNPTQYSDPSNPWGTSTTTNNPSNLGPSSYSDDAPPALPPRRSATDLALPTGQDRSHQIEVMQSYEAAGRRDEDDQNVEMLQREFPKIDGSLIAAIYGDSKSLSATREMLGELDS